MKNHQYESSKVGSYARSILCFVYNDCIEFNPITSNNKNVVIGTESINTDQDLKDFYYTLKLFPNPSTEYTIANLEIKESIKDAEIVITGLEGEVYFNQSITSEYSEIVLNLEKLSAGIYFVNIYNKGILQKTEKLLITSK